MAFSSFRQVCFLISLTFSLVSVPTSANVHIKATPIRDIGPRIINGDEAQLGQFKWQVGIHGVNSNGGFFCGGSLIDSEWVLTAGHCLVGTTSAYIYTNITKISDIKNRVVSQAAQFIIHEKYAPLTLGNDIGLIRLRAPVRLNENTQPIALAKKDPPVNTTVTVSGWGITSDNSILTSDILYYTNIKTIENSECVKYFGASVIKDAVICANPGDPHTSPCQGDSGAPVVVMDSCGKPVQIGVFSFTNGYGCEYPYPSGNSRVAFYREWIKGHTGI